MYFDLFRIVAVKTELCGIATILLRSVENRSVLGRMSIVKALMLTFGMLSEWRNLLYPN